MSDPTRRALRLLSLLESRASWTGPELAERLGVTVRTVRRDVDRLRELGYPVQADRGLEGGYRLGSGRRLPPLLLDDDEAVAIAVCLKMAAGESVEGISDAAVRVLAKLDQVLPARLRAEVNALQAGVATLPGQGPTVDPQALSLLARAAWSEVRVRFGYVARDGTTSSRSVEPYRLVTTGQRWYLFCWDLDRAEWRTFRVDRIDEIQLSTMRFTPRPTPDPVEQVQRAVTVGGHRWKTLARLGAPASRVRALVPAAVGTVTEDGDGALLAVAGDYLDSIAWHLVRVAATLDAALTAVSPPELAVQLREFSRICARAAEQ